MCACVTTVWAQNTPGQGEVLMDTGRLYSFLWLDGRCAALAPPWAGAVAGHRARNCQQSSGLALAWIHSFKLGAKWRRVPGMAVVVALCLAVVALCLHRTYWPPGGVTSTHTLALLKRFCPPVMQDGTPLRRRIPFHSPSVKSAELWVIAAAHDATKRPSAMSLPPALKSHVEVPW